jgi:hypothetical protein
MFQSFKLFYVLLLINFIFVEGSNLILRQYINSGKDLHKPPQFVLAIDVKIISKLQIFK